MVNPEKYSMIQFVYWQMAFSLIVKAALESPVYKLLLLWMNQVNVSDDANDANMPVKNPLTCPHCLLSPAQCHKGLS